MTPAPSSLNLQLLLGTLAPTPAPAYITEKLQSVEITSSADGASGFQLLFNADRAKGLSQDFDLLSSSLLQPWTRVIVVVTAGSVPSVLMDGFITRQELSHSKEFSTSSIAVTGEDVSVIMDRVEYSMEYPQMGDSMIAALVLAKYSLVGIIPNVIPTEADLIPIIIEQVPQQNSTDRAYLRTLATPYGYIFSVRPGSAAMVNVAYWGPPPRSGFVSPALSIDVGPATNVENISFTYDALAATQVYGLVQDDITEEDLPLATLTSTRLPAFATNPGLNALSLFQRRDVFTDPRYTWVESMVDAQAMTDVSTDKVVTCTGQLDTTRYGSILTAPGLVDIRGAGQSYDGRYYVASVTHSLRRGSYKQQFTLSREGTGSTISVVGQ